MIKEGGGFYLFFTPSPDGKGGGRIKKTYKWQTSSRDGGERRGKRKPRWKNNGVCGSELPAPPRDSEGRALPVEEEEESPGNIECDPDRSKGLADYEQCKYRHRPVGNLLKRLHCTTGCFCVVPDESPTRMPGRIWTRGNSRRRNAVIGEPSPELVAFKTPGLHLKLQCEVKLLCLQNGIFTFRTSVAQDQSVIVRCRAGNSSDLVPRLSLPNLEAGYHGLVKENETLVEVTPKIVGVGAKICDFHIVNKHHGEAPFQTIRCRPVLSGRPVFVPFRRQLERHMTETLTRQLVASIRQLSRSCPRRAQTRNKASLRIWKSRDPPPSPISLEQPATRSPCSPWKHLHIPRRLMSPIDYVLPSCSALLRPGSPFPLFGERPRATAGTRQQPTPVMFHARLLSVFPLSAASQGPGEHPSRHECFQQLPTEVGLAFEQTKILPLRCVRLDKWVDVMKGPRLGKAGRTCVAQSAVLPFVHPRQPRGINNPRSDSSKFATPSRTHSPCVNGCNPRNRPKFRTSGIGNPVSWFPWSSTTLGPLRPCSKAKT
ncbi:unnamed protein product, partial [Nesidiocoris tenuis]